MHLALAPETVNFPLDPSGSQKDLRMVQFSTLLQCLAMQCAVSTCTRCMHNVIGSVTKLCRECCTNDHAMQCSAGCRQCKEEEARDKHMPGTGWVCLTGLKTTDCSGRTCLI